MDALGPKQVIAYARRFGLTAPLPPYLPVALGAAEETLIEMTSAYSVFPNQGVRMAPYIDPQGHRPRRQPPRREPPGTAGRHPRRHRLRDDQHPPRRRQHGTAIKAAALNWPVAGKTGTTDDFSDAWFIGFDPDITLGVWVGYDQKKPLGSGMTGAEAALPIWMTIMKAYIGDRKDAPKFEPPGNIVFVSIDKAIRDGRRARSRSLHRRHPAGVGIRAAAESMAHCVAEFGNEVRIRRAGSTAALTIRARSTRLRRFVQPESHVEHRPDRDRRHPDRQSLFVTSSSGRRRQRAAAFFIR